MTQPLTPPQADLVRAIRRISNSCGPNVRWQIANAPHALRMVAEMEREGRVA